MRGVQCSVNSSDHLRRRADCRLKKLRPIPAPVQHADDEQAALGEALDDEMGMIGVEADWRSELGPLPSDRWMHGKHFEGRRQTRVVVIGL